MSPHFILVWFCLLGLATYFLAGALAQPTPPFKGKR